MSVKKLTVGHLEPVTFDSFHNSDQTIAEKRPNLANQRSSIFNPQQGCQIFLDTIHQNGENVPNYHYVDYQMAIIYTKFTLRRLPNGNKMYQIITTEITKWQ
jgi:hypothetical protein